MTRRVALVTGATQGIGRATALLLARAGYAVAVTARTKAKVEALVTELEELGGPAAGIAADVAEADPVAELHRHVVDRLGPVDVLVNNAGIAIAKPIEDLTLDEWDRTFATNVRSLFLLTRAVLPAMRSRRAGDIVNIASLAGKHGAANLVAYSASKHAVMGFSRSLLLETRKDGIRVLAICPGSVDTPLMRNQSVLSPNYDRILQPEDVARTVVDALALPARALVSELEVRPANP
jgi:3-oxoacyl-[acyl-carrier protein] reductase